MQVKTCASRLYKIIQAFFCTRGVVGGVLVLVGAQLISRDALLFDLTTHILVSVSSRA